MNKFESRVPSLDQDSETEEKEFLEGYIELILEKSVKINEEIERAHV